MSFFIGIFNLFCPEIDAQIQIEAIAGEVTTPVGYGQTLRVSGFVVSETDLTDFGDEGYYSIWLTAPDGFKFSGMSTRSTIGKVQQTPEVKNDSQASEVNLSFDSGDDDTARIDTITISNVELTPIGPYSPSYTYSGNIDIEVFKVYHETNYSLASESYGPYSMAQPKLVFDFYEGDTVCMNSPSNFKIKVEDSEGTVDNKDIITVTYDSTQSTGTTLIDKDGLGSLEKEVHITSLKDGYNKINVHVLYQSGWDMFAEFSLSSDKSTNPDIYRVPTAPVKLMYDNDSTLPPLGTVYTSLYISDYLLNQHVFNPDTSTWNIKFASTETNYITKSNGEYVFHPDIAGKGEHEITVTQTYKGSSFCESTSSFYISVPPKVINVDEFCCYGLNKMLIVSIAEAALENAGGDSIEVSFHSLKVTGGGGTLQTIPADRGTENGGYLNFSLNVDSLYNSVVDNTEGGAVGVLKLHLFALAQLGKASYVIGMEDEEVSIAIPRNNGEITNLDTSYCYGQDSILLKPSYEQVDTIIGNSIAWHDDSYYLKFDSVYSPDSNSHESIVYKYIDDSTCPGITEYNITIHAKPKVAFEADPICVGDTQQFIQYSPDSNVVNIEGWAWDFDEGYTISNMLDASKENVEDGDTHGGTTGGSYQRPYHIYDTPGIKHIALGVKSDAGCESFDSTDIVIGKYPEPEFTFAGKLQDSITMLYNNTEFYEDDPVVNYTYYITSPSSDQDSLIQGYPKDTSFTPIEYGVYKVKLQATTGNSCRSAIDTLIPVFPVVKVTNDNLYSENFSPKDSQEGWLSSDQYFNRLESSWTHVPVSGVFNDGNHHQDGHMWLVGAPLDSLDNESSWLESPCFDLSELGFPMVSLDLMQSLEENSDGAALYYSLNDGDSWELLGEIDENGEGGQDWYNADGIFSYPEKNDITYMPNKKKQGWSKDTTDWVSARYPIDSLREASVDSATGCVRFRIAYNSNNAHSLEHAGLGVDNFIVGKRKRIILLEQFINSEYDRLNPPGYVYDSVDLNDFVDRYPEEVVDIRYHCSTNSIKDNLWGIFYETSNDNDIKAMLYHARGWGSLWAMDGQAVLNKTDEFEGLGITYEQGFKKRGLVDPAFDIYDVKTENSNGALKITATIKKISSHIDEKLGEHEHNVRMAIVQKEYIHSDGNTYRNVLIDLLPTRNGDIVKKLTDFAVGDVQTVSETWTPQYYKTVGNNYRLIIFVQGRSNYHEVEQVWFRDLETIEVPQVYDSKPPESNEEQELTELEEIDQGKIGVYPNPASEVLNVRIPDGSSLNATWSVYSISGQEVMGGKTTFEGESSSLDVSSLKEGLYILRLNDNNDWQYSCKFSILKN